MESIAVGGKQPPAKAPAKAKAPEKKGNVKALEEITDNRPRTVKYERNCAEENGDVGLEVNEPVAIKFASTFMTIEITETDRETLEEKTIETISLDMSSLLHSDSPICVSIIIAI